MDLKNKRVLLTAGATYEPIDPVRFIGNRSTGKMGISIVSVLLEKGAKVDLVLGEHQIEPSVHPHLKVYSVHTALEMYDQCLAIFPEVDLVIKTAAVSDYRPAHFSAHKIKKGEETLNLVLVKNPDILYELGQRKTHQKLLGFALETDQEAFFALGKLKHKNLDAIVLNSLQEKGAGFGLHTNAVTFFDALGHKKKIPLQNKEAVAAEICQCIEDFL